MSEVSWTNMRENNQSLGLGLDQDLDLDLDLDLFPDQTELMNQPWDNNWLNCIICVLTITVNIWAMKVLKSKEDHCITRLVNWDFLITIFISVDTFLINSNFGFPLNISAICAVQNATTMALSAFTSLVPVAIVVLRYIMVCHPAFFIDCGKEKGIWKWILGSVITLCLAIWCHSLYNSAISFRFLRCMGREEDFG